MLSSREKMRGRALRAASVLPSTWYDLAMTIRVQASWTSDVVGELRSSAPMAMPAARVRTKATAVPREATAEAR